MTSIDIITDGDNCWPDLQSKAEDGRLIDLTGKNTGSTKIAVARLRGGMTSGKSSVTIRIDLPDGRTVIAETSLSLFLAAAQVFKSREDAENSGELN